METKTGNKGIKIATIIGKMAGIFKFLRALIAAFETFSREYGYSTEQKEN